MAALKDLKVMIGDILNVYITAPITKKVGTVHGFEFGSDTGKSAIIVHTLYGLKSVGTAFRTYLASLCVRWGTRLVKQTLTYAFRLRPGPMTTLGIMPTSYVTLMISYVYTMTL
jgi:hypothetical protein